MCDGYDCAVENQEMQTRVGARVALLSRSQIQERWPWMRVDDVEVATLGLEHEGLFDPSMLLAALRRKCLDDGVRFVYGDVIGFDIGRRTMDCTDPNKEIGISTLPTDIRHILVFIHSYLLSPLSSLNCIRTFLFLGTTFHYSLVSHSKPR